MNATPWEESLAVAVKPGQTGQFLTRQVLVLPMLGSYFALHICYDHDSGIFSPIVGRLSERTVGVYKIKEQPAKARGHSDRELLCNNNDTDENS